MMRAALTVHNGEAAAFDEVPVVSIKALGTALAESMRSGLRLCALFGIPAASGRLSLYAVVGDDAAGRLMVLASEVGSEYPALTPECPQAHLFEREIAEEFGVTPQGHPGLKPVRFRRGGEPGVTEFFRVEGEEVHEVAVGPVHAGVIEPGHFRFQCHGERVLHLEIALGYQHRGVERALAGGPNARTVPYLETLAGDTTAGHALAGCHAIEALSQTRCPPRAQGIRGIALELERMANHAGDLGALAGDIGYLPTASYCGRLRGDLLNLTALLCGSRFGRGLICPGGVRFDIEEGRDDELVRRLAEAMRDLESAVGLLWKTASVLARFEETGALDRATAQAIGLVGVAARAAGIERDVRQDYPTGIYRFFHIPLSSWHSGDVFGRAFVRWLEISRSAAFIREQVAALAGGPIAVPAKPLEAGRMAISLTEGWRGEICHVAITGDDGRLAQYKVVDPSFHNWMGLSLAMRGQEISDFPLCNKSFNLSYCGHDL